MVRRIRDGRGDERTWSKLEKRGVGGEKYMEGREMHSFMHCPDHSTPWTDISYTGFAHTFYVVKIRPLNAFINHTFNTCTCTSPAHVTHLSSTHN